VKNLIKKHAEKIRFGIVGIAATAIDWVILFTLVVLGSPSIASNFVSTSVAMVFSFFTNKSYTFKTDNVTRKHFVYFIIITIVGMWVIQPLIIQSIEWALGPWFTESCPMRLAAEILGTWFKPNYAVLLIAKGIATAASLTWNYLMYRRFVFNKN